MNPTKYTQGPWVIRVDNSGQKFIYRQRSWDGDVYTHPIAQTRGDPRSANEHKANASLIAAAPDLYEALSSILDSADFNCNQRLAYAARVALAKAREGV